jgi:hypothetical protein
MLAGENLAGICRAVYGGFLVVCWLAFVRWRAYLAAGEPVAQGAILLYTMSYTPIGLHFPPRCCWYCS